MRKKVFTTLCERVAAELRAEQEKTRQLGYLAGLLFAEQSSYKELIAEIERVKAVCQPNS